jgi:sulfotransferase family protein
MATSQKRKVIYVLGASRSGSTLFDIVLGTSPEICSSGELIHLPDRGWLNNEYCACGRRVNECGFWRDVRSRFTARLGPGAVERFLGLQHRFERMRFLLLGARLLRDPEFQEYLRELDWLLLCVLEACGKRYLVDSSKKQVRAFYLSMAADFEVYLVHLVRDSRGVAWSKAKAFAKDERRGVQRDLRPAPVARTARHWLLTNLVCSCLFLFSHRRRGRYLRIRYEDFVAEPAAVLRRIGEFCEVDLAEPIRKLREGAALRVEHTVAGNRLRMDGPVRIRPDLEWREKLSPGQESTVWRWTGWLLRRYGYAR